MKQLVTISFFVLFIYVNSALAQSQVNVIHRMDKQGLRWTEVTQFIDGGNNNCPSFTDDVYEYYTKGDTIINGLKYVKLFHTDKYEDIATNEQQCSWCPCVLNFSSFYPPHDTFLVCALREDTSGKVFIHVFDTMKFLGNSLIGRIAYYSELLIYDFKWKVGDTLPNAIQGYKPIINKVDSLMLPDSTYRKSFSLSNYDVIIEGIGTKMSLFGVLMVRPIDGGNRLMCFRDSSHSFFSYKESAGAKNTCDSSEYYGTSTIDIAYITPSPFKIYPNPTSGIAYINFLTQTQGTTLQVYNITGSLLKTLSISKPNTQIDVSSYANGVYILKLTDKHGATCVQRLIVNR